MGIRIRMGMGMGMGMGIRMGNLNIWKITREPSQ